MTTATIPGLNPGLLGVKRLYGLYRIVTHARNEEEPIRQRQGEAYTASEAAKVFCKDIANAHLRGEYWDVRPLDNIEVAAHRDLVEFIQAATR